MKGNESYCGDKRRECWTERERDQSREGNMKGRDWRGKPDMTDGTGKERDESREGRAGEGTTEEDPPHRTFFFLLFSFCFFKGNSRVWSDGEGKTLCFLKKSCLRPPGLLRVSGAKAVFL